MRPKVLFIEDDFSQVGLYGKKFEMEGFEFMSAGDGKEGMAAAKEKQPDLIFLDILMPGENGLEVLKKLKKDKTTKGIPTILFTNLSDKISRKKSKEMGAVDFLVKTDISLNDLVVKAREHLKIA